MFTFLLTMSCIQRALHSGTEALLTFERRNSRIFASIVGATCTVNFFTARALGRGNVLVDCTWPRRSAKKFYWTQNFLIRLTGAVCTKKQKKKERTKKEKNEKKGEGGKKRKEIKLFNRLRQLPAIIPEIPLRQCRGWFIAGIILYSRV